MTINPETLKSLRGNLSQEALAVRTGVSKRQLSRIEAGHTRPEKIRARTVERIAKALGVTVEELNAPLDSDSEAKRQGFSGQQVKMWLDSEAQFYFDAISHFYGVSFDDLVHATPWMFTLLAEASLAERRRRLDEGRAAFENAMDQLPQHLSHGTLRRDFERACEAEQQSISARDLFGKRMLEQAASGPVDRDVSNPFGELLSGLAQSCDPGAIRDFERFDHPGSLPRWMLFTEWLGWLGGDDDSGEACRALLDGHARIGDIPEELLADDRGSDRAAWLHSKLPAPGKLSKADMAELISQFRFGASDSGPEAES